LLPKQGDQFSLDLLEWAENMQFKQIVNLTSCHSYERVDSQITGSQLRFVLNESAEDTCGDLFTDKFEWKKFEMKCVDDDEMLFMPGSGFSMKLQKASIKSNVKVVILSIFCNEGNNKSESIEMADSVDKWLQLKNKVDVRKWTFPSSWKNFFGPPIPSGLF